MGRMIDRLLRKATSAGLRRGLSGEHWAWLLVAGAAFVLRRARTPSDDTVTLDLSPGDRYEVAVLAPGGGRARRGASKGRPADDAPAGGSQRAPAD